MISFEEAMSTIEGTIQNFKYRFMRDEQLKVLQWGLDEWDHELREKAAHVYKTYARGYDAKKESGETIGKFNTYLVTAFYRMRLKLLDDKVFPMIDGVHPRRHYDLLPNDPNKSDDYKYGIGESKPNPVEEEEYIRLMKHGMGKRACAIIDKMLHGTTMDEIEAGYKERKDYFLKTKQQIIERMKGIADGTFIPD